MKLNDDRHHREQEFEVGESVYLKLQPFQQLSIRVRGNLKLSSRFYRPYHVLDRVGKVAYRLDLPSHSRLHPVFHVSQLKKQLGQLDCAAPELPDVTTDGDVILVPKWLIDFRWIKHGRTVTHELLVQWVGISDDDATWESYVDLQIRFPHMNLEDKIRLKGEGNVMNSDTAVQSDSVSQLSGHEG